MLPKNSECSCGFFCDNHLGCSLPCPQSLWERTALVQPIFRSKGVESKCWNDLIGGWLGRGRCWISRVMWFSPTDCFIADIVLTVLLPGHTCWRSDLMLGWMGLSCVWMLLISQLSCLQKTFVEKNPLKLACILHIQWCIVYAMWWQSVILLIS